MLQKISSIKVPAARFSGTVVVSGLLSYFLNNPEMTSRMALELGIGGAMLIEGMKQLNGISSNILHDCVKEGGELVRSDVNHDLEKALKSAYEDGFANLQAELFHELGIKFGLTKKVRDVLRQEISEEQYLAGQLHAYFSGTLYNYLTSDTALEKLIATNGQLDLKAYLTKTFRSTSDALKLENSIIDKKFLIRFVIDKFPGHFAKGFLKALKLNEKAKTAYFKLLLEQGIVQMTKVKMDTGQIIRLIKTLHTLAVQTGNDLSAIKTSINIQQQELNSLVDRFANQENLLSEIAGKLENLDQWAPNLTLYTEKPDHFGLNLFSFKTRYLEFFGREDEKSRLADFLEGERPLQWWSIGGELGSGKSRLAMEICYMARAQGYYAGFYEAGINNQLPNDRRPLIKDQPMLIVIDQAAANAQNTIRLLEFLNGKIYNQATPDGSGYKVRVLLLDRYFTSSWTDTLYAFRNSCFTEKSNCSALTLQPDAEDLRWRIIIGFIKKQQLTNESAFLEEIRKEKEAVLNRLALFDSLKRPLFTYFFVENLIRDPLTEKSSYISLLNYQLKRVENEIWKAYEDFGRYSFQIKQLMFTNILLRKMTLSDVRNVIAALGNYSDPEREAIEAVYERVSDRYEDSGRTIFAGLQADYLSGFFLLDTATVLLKKERQEQLVRLLNICWQRDPEAVTHTCTLLFEDYFNLPVNGIEVFPMDELEKIFFMDPVHILNEEISVQQSQLTWNICRLLGKKRSHWFRLKYDTKIEGIYTSFPSNHAIALVFAKSLAKYAVYLTNSTVVTDEANGDLTRLKRIQSSAPFHRDGQIALQLAITYNHLLTGSSDDDFVREQEQQYLAEFKVLVNSQEFRDDEEVALEYSKTLHVLSELYYAESLANKPGSMLAQLREIQQRFPGHYLIAVELAEILLKLIQIGGQFFKNGAIFFDQNLSLFLKDIKALYESPLLNQKTDLAIALAEACLYRLGQKATSPKITEEQAGWFEIMESLVDEPDYQDVLEINVHFLNSLMFMLRRIAVTERLFNKAVWISRRETFKSDLYILRPLMSILCERYERSNVEDFLNTSFAELFSEIVRIFEDKGRDHSIALSFLNVLSHHLTHSFSGGWKLQVHFVISFTVDIHRLHSDDEAIAVSLMHLLYPLVANSFIHHREEVETLCMPIVLKLSEKFAASRMVSLLAVYCIRCYLEHTITEMNLAQFETFERRIMRLTRSYVAEAIVQQELQKAADLKQQIGMGS